MSRSTGQSSSYVRVAGRLREQILAGELSPGAKLSSERDLCERFGTSRVTVRRALRTLEEERLIVRRHGSGTYVGVRPERRIPLMIDYTSSMQDHAPSLDRRLLVSRRERADTFAAETLQLAEDAEILYVERVDYLDGQPVAWDRGYIAAAYAAGLKKTHLAQVEFSDGWPRACGFEIESCRQTVEAVPANALVSRQLGIPRSRPVLKSTELYLAQHERPAGLYVSFYNPAHICIASRYRWGDAGTGKPSRKRGRA